MLGFIFKCVRGLAPKRCQTLFERVPSQTLHSIPCQDHRHSIQLVDPIGFRPTVILQRSVYGLVSVWSALPQEVVSQSGVKAFHHLLTVRAKEVLRNGSSISDLCDLRWIHFRYGTEQHVS